MTIFDRHPNLSLLKHSLVLALVLLCSLHVLSQGEADRPNILFILTDDQRFDALGYAGNELAKTPAMDQLASEGAYFKKAFVTTPICAASRATLLTGLHERTHGYNFHTSGIQPAFMNQSYPRLLREAGYHTGFYGKLGVRTNLQADLFDAYEVYDRNGAYRDRRGYFYKTLDGDTVHLTRYTGQQALDFIESAPNDRPFCLSLSFSAPHAHDGAEEQYFWQESQNAWLENIQVPEAARSSDKYFQELPTAVRDGFNRTRWYWRYDTPEKYQHSVKGYHRMISGVDNEIGKIRAMLEQQGLADNTVIILMGDNGYFLGERQLAGKWLMYENSIRVPLIIFDPRNSDHREIDEMALNVDVPSTILDLANVREPTTWQGRSLMPLVNGTGSLDRDAILIEHLWEFDNIPPSEGVRTHDWKYFTYLNNRSEEELYDLVKDPNETKNLAGNKRYREKLLEMRNQLASITKSFEDTVLGKPAALSVELIREPAGTTIVDPMPEYNWEVPSGTQSQRAYQILVASSKEKLRLNDADVWNSGRVRSKASFNIEHGGGPLEDGQTYFWKVRIWGDLNRLTPNSEMQAFTYQSDESRLTSHNIFQMDEIKPVVFEAVGNSQYFADFGKDAFGALKLSYQTEVAETLTIRLGEQLTSDGSIERDPMGHIRFQEVSMPVSPGNNEYIVPLVPDERNTKAVAVALPDSFPVIMPFRYVEIEGGKSDIASDGLTQMAFYAYFDEDQSAFISSDTVLNQVWDLCKYSMKATSFAGVYVDGDRERIPYEADAYINQLSHYAVDREYAITRRTIEYFMEKPTWPTEWQLHVALMFYDDYLYTGDPELIERYYEPLKYKTLMDLAREDGLITTENVTPEIMRNLGFKDPETKLRDIVDWPPSGWGGDPNVLGERDGFDFQPINTVVNSFYYRNLEILAEFAALLGKDDDANRFQMMALRAKSAINEKLFDNDRGIYLDGEGTDHASLHANMLPLAMGIVPRDKVPSVVEFIKSRDMACSVYGAQYLMDGLYNVGEADYALELMTATHDRSWWNMIAIGSTITLEAWDMKYKPNADWNHAWGAVPGNIIARRMWGITPKVPGGSIVNIAPQLSTLRSTSISVPFQTGQVKAAYEKVHNRLERYVFDLPGNVSAEVILPTADNQSVYVDGLEANASFKTIRLSPGQHVVELRISSF